MLHYGPFKGIENAWDDDDFARFLAHLVGNGVYPNPSTGLQVIQNENMTVVVKPGAAWINGRFLYSDGDIVLNFDNADGVLKRIDRVILRLNHVERKIEIAIKKGTFASSPVAPTLQRDADYHELALADVFINAGATSITQANITDQRLNTDVCGIVHGTVDQVDTTTIFNQYKSWFDTFTVEQKQEFDAWFATVQNVLNGDVAGNLLNLITANTASINTHKNDEFSHNIAVKTIKSEKDDNGVFTVVRTYKKSNNNLYQESILSGGISPKYTTRTITTFADDGTVVRVDTFANNYDADDDLFSEV